MCKSYSNKSSILTLSSGHVYLVEAAMEEFFDFIPFKCDSLELSFKIMVEERQRFSRVCGENIGEGQRQALGLLFLLLVNSLVDFRHSAQS